MWESGCNTAYIQVTGLTCLLLLHAQYFAEYVLCCFCHLNLKIMKEFQLRCWYTFGVDYFVSVKGQVIRSICRLLILRKN